MGSTENVGEKMETDELSTLQKNLNEIPEAGKPKVWIRICQSSNVDTLESNIYQLAEDGKKFQVLIEPVDRILQKKKKQKTNDTYFTFNCDGIIYPSLSQQDLYKTVVKDVVSKAMEGVSGMVLSLGPELCGKSYTLFGNIKQFDNRGVLPRALETIFDIISKKRKEVNYIIQLGVVEARKNYMRDLLSPDVSEIRKVVKNGPLGMRFQEIRCIEHGLGLLMLALSTRKVQRLQPNTKCHLVVYFDITGEILFESKEKSFKSRITFVKMGSLPTRLIRAQQLYRAENISPVRDCFQEPKPCSSLRNQILSINPNVSMSSNVNSGPTAEDIELRKDIFLVEQMFIRTQQLHRLNKLYSKLKKLGMKMLMKRPNLIPAEYFHQCKLAYCIQDVVRGDIELRLVVHMRLENQLLPTILESLRFAEMVKCIPHKVDHRHLADNPESLRRELSLLLKELELQEKLAKRPPELASLLEYPSRLTRNRKRIYDAAAFLDGKLDEIEIINKRQVKAMFETFRTMWKYASDQQVLQDQEAPKETIITDAIPEPPSTVENEPVQENDETPLPAPLPTSRPRVASTGKKRKPRSGKRVKKTNSRRKSSQADEANLANYSKDETVPIGYSDQQVDVENKAEQFTKIIGHAGEKEGSFSVEHLDKSLPTNKTNSFDNGEVNPEWNPLLPPDFITKEDGGPNNEAGVTRASAWANFIDTDEGRTLLEEANKTSAVLTNCIGEYDENLKKLKATLTKSIQYLEDFDKIQEDRILKRDLADFSMAFHTTPLEKTAFRDIKSIESSRDDILEMLNKLRATMEAEKSMIGRKRNECDDAFQQFCLRQFGFAFGKEDSSSNSLQHVSLKEQALTKNDLNTEAEDQTRAQSYYEILDYARKQAKRINRPEIKKPGWKSY